MTTTFSLAGLVGWGLYAVGLVAVITGWPFARPIGVIAILLGLLDHGRCIWRARGEAEAYDWKTD